MEEVSSALGMQKGGTVSDYLEDLVITEYVSRDFTFNLEKGKPSKLSRYRLKDNYLRFYLKYIEPNSAKILQNDLYSIPAWDSIMGLQFENLVLNNRRSIKSLLHLKSDEIVFDNPYFQKATKEKSGCQIDYLILTRYNSVHVCEVKFSKNILGLEVIEELKSKIDRLQLAKNFSVWPVLINVNGVSEEVEKSGFFSSIINFSDLLS